jgi:hypothetical protein
MASHNANPAITICTALTGTGTTDAVKIDSLKSLQIKASDTFSLQLKGSLDGTNYFLLYPDPLTTSDIYLVDEYNDIYVQLNITANAGTITAMVA